MLGHGDEGKRELCRSGVMLTKAPMNRLKSHSLTNAPDMSCLSFYSIVRCVVGYLRQQIHLPQGGQLCGHRSACQRRGSHGNYERYVVCAGLDEHILCHFCVEKGLCRGLGALVQVLYF